MATAVVVLAQLYIAIPLADPVAADLGGAGVTAALSTGYAVCYALGFLVYGPLSDHFGRRRVLVWGLVALTVTTALVSFAPSVAILGVLRGAQGAAAATFAPTALAWLGEALPPSKRAVAIGAMSVAFLAAGIVGQVSASPLAASWGWQCVFYAGTACLVVLSFALMKVLPASSSVLAHGSFAARYAALLRFAARPTSLLLGLGHMAVLAGFVATYTVLGPHLADQGLTAMQILLVRAVGLPAMLVSLLAGRVARRTSPPVCAALAYALCAAGLVLVALGARNIVTLSAASLVFVAGVALAVPTLIAIWGEASAPARGTGMALNGFVLFLGASIGPYAVAIPAGFTGTLLVVAAVYLAGAAVVWGAGRAIQAAANA